MSLEPVYLEDLSPGMKHVGVDRHEMTEEAIIAFATLYDPQPFHTDPEAARDSLFEGLAASGWHTAAATMRLIVATAPFVGGVIGSGGEVTWPKPTRPGDVLRVETEVLEVIPSRSKPDRGRVAVRCVTYNQRDEVAQVFVAQLVVPRRPAA